MSTWSGWRAELLAGAGLPYTQGASKFLGDWHTHASTNCQNNPVDISHSFTGSKRCRQLPGLTVYSRAYASPANGAQAFGEQVNQGAYSHILKALHDGDPYALNATDAGLVSEELVAWGSTAFAHIYFGNVANPTPPGLAAPRLHSGWRAMQVSVNEHMPKDLTQARQTIDAGLRTLAKARKVRF